MRSDMANSSERSIGASRFTLPAMPHMSRLDCERRADRHGIEVNPARLIDLQESGQPVAERRMWAGGGLGVGVEQEFRAIGRRSDPKSQHAFRAMPDGGSH